MLVEDGLGAAVAALLRRPGIVADAIQAHPEVGAALVAALTPSRLAGQRPFPTALVAMTVHADILAKRGFFSRAEPA